MRQEIEPADPSLGPGSALMAAGLDLADDFVGLRRVAVTALADNSRALGLYEKFGFEREGVGGDYVYRQGE